jgi:hypothetical protein
MDSISAHNSTKKTKWLSHTWATFSSWWEDIASLGHRVTKSRTLFLGAGKFRKRALETSIARNSIGNRFPVQKYIEAMVRKSIRVVLVAENDSIEVASDAGADQPRRSSPRRLGRRRAVQGKPWILEHEIWNLNLGIVRTVCGPRWVRGLHSRVVGSSGDDSCSKQIVFISLTILATFSCTIPQNWCKMMKIHQKTTQNNFLALSLDSGRRNRSAIF